MRLEKERVKLFRIISGDKKQRGHTATGMSPLLAFILMPPCGKCCYQRKPIYTRNVLVRIFEPMFCIGLPMSPSS